MDEDLIATVKWVDELHGGNGPDSKYDYITKRKILYISINMVFKPLIQQPCHP